MRPYYLSLLFLFITSISLQSQQLLDGHWFFCHHDSVSNLGSAYFDFRQAPPVSPIHINNEMGHFLTNASISDPRGNLLFYTNGCFIANSAHEKMKNGDSLNLRLDGRIDVNCRGTLPIGDSSQDGALILPQPAHDSMYYLFHLREHFTDTFNGAYSIHYTLVNMNLDDGLGAVVAKNVIMEDDWIWNEELKAVRHANDRDWWIVVQDRPGTDYLRWLLSPNGLEGPFRQSDVEGPTPHPGATGGSFVAFSPDGSKYARNLRWAGQMLYDFDRQTGKLSNFRQIKAPYAVGVNYDVGGGLAFSPSSRYLYANNIDTIWQYDTEAVDVAASRTVVAVYDGFTQWPNGWGGTNFRQMRLGPDCRIYIAPINFTSYMHVINWPDSAGLACDVQQRAIRLPCINSNSMPNFAHYRLGTPYATCDMSLHTVSSTVTSVSAPPVFEEGEAFSVFPNPASDHVQLSIAQPSQLRSIKLYNSMGQQLESYGQLSSSMHISVSELPRGIYFLVLTDIEGKSFSQKLSVLHQ